MGIVCSESQFATDRALSPWVRPSGTSLSMLRMVRVIGATVTAVRTRIADVLVTTRTGRRPSGSGKMAR